MIKLYMIRSYRMIRHTIGSSIWTEGVSAVSTGNTPPPPLEQWPLRLPPHDPCNPSIKRKCIEGEGEENRAKKKIHHCPYAIIWPPNFLSGEKLGPMKL